jgi:hypothetical protein
LAVYPAILQLSTSGCIEIGQGLKKAVCLSHCIEGV